MDNGAGSYRRFLDGDESGFADIIRDYKDGLILYLNGFTKNIYTAEELAEDTFVKIIIKKPRYNGRSSFKTWLYAIGRNTALTHMKKSSEALQIPVEECEQLMREQESLEFSYLKEERKIALHKAMSGLKSEYRQVLWLVYFEDLSLKEVAGVMKKSVHSTETLVWRARQSLKNKLTKEGFEYEELQ